MNAEQMSNDSIQEKFQGLADMGGTMQQIIFRDANEKPIAAAVFVLGPVETTEILAAVKAVEHSWHADLPTAETVPAETEPFMYAELRHWLDRQVITSETIGSICRQLFVPWDSKWNGIVRDETAARENKPMASV